jgi:hypothetical protein
MTPNEHSCFHGVDGTITTFYSILRPFQNNFEYPNPTTTVQIYLHWTIDDCHDLVMTLEIWQARLMFGRTYT